MRAELVRAVDRLGAGPYLRRAQGLVDPNMRRARRDDEHLRLLLAFVLSSESNCIDVGCHEGMVLSEMVRIAPQGHHIAYEPLPHLAQRLRQSFPAVDVRNAALSDVSGETSFVHVTTRPDYSGLQTRPHPGADRFEQIRVQVEDLDSHLTPGYVPTLIKIDVEGAEVLVLQGAIETISRHRPVVVFEHGKPGAQAYGAGPNDVHHLLSDVAGLRIFDLDGNGPYSRARFESTFEEGRRWNFVAHR